MWGRRWCATAASAIAAYEADQAKVGQPIGDLTIQDVAALPDVVRELNVQVAMIAAPAKVAQDIADLCVKGGVRAILNYAPINLAVPEDVRVQYLDPVTHLQRMTYYLP
jgi:redox-sensing transcriptional repressor